MCRKTSRRGRRPAWLNRALAGTQEKKESLCPLEEGAGHSGELQGYHEVMQGESSKSQSLART